MGELTIISEVAQVAKVLKKVLTVLTRSIINSCYLTSAWPSNNPLSDCFFSILTVVVQTFLHRCFILYWEFVLISPSLITFKFFCLHPFLSSSKGNFSLFLIPFLIGWTFKSIVSYQFFFLYLTLLFYWIIFLFLFPVLLSPPNIPYSF